MDWFVLGIEPTKDKKAITAAYRQKLRQTNPEEKPEEFKALRAAYEEALKLADQEDVVVPKDESPVGRWAEKVKALYNDYPSRIDPDQWRELVSDDICMGLDTRPLAEEALLALLMEHYFIPRTVWAVLDEAFHFGDRTEELCEHYPREFVEQVVINGIRLEQTLPYELFIPGRNGQACDSYRMLYYKACRTDPVELATILEELDKLPERHPHGELMRLNYAMQTGREDEGREGLSVLAAEYPDDITIVLSWASVCLNGSDAEQAKALAEKILEQYPGNVPAMNVLAKSLAAMGDYNEAKEIGYDMIHSCGGNPVAMDEMTEQMRQWNKAIIQQREARHEEDPTDTDNAMELAWCYAQNECPDQAMELARSIDPQQAEPFMYHNLMGKLLHNEENFAEALEYLQKVEQIVRDMQPDGTEKTEKRMKRLPEMLQVQGNCLMQLGRNEEAREKFQQALEIAPDDPEVLILMGKILFTAGDYPYAVEILDRLRQVSPDAWHAEVLLALCLYKLRRDREAFEAVNRAMAMQCYDLSLYVLNMQILMRNGVWDEVHAILKFLEESGAPADVSVDFVKAKLTELEQKDAASAFKQYQQIARGVEAGQELLWAPELYYRMALLMGDQMDVDNAEDREVLLATVEKGLSYDPQDEDCLAYKAWLLKQNGQIREAMDMYRALEEKNPHAPTGQRGLAELYYEYVHLYAEEALEYFEKCLAEQKTPLLYFYAAVCKRQMGDLEGARKYYRREMEMDPDDIDAYRGLAFICDAEGKYEESISLLDQAIAIMDASGRCFHWLLEHKVQILRRMGRYDEAMAFVDQMVSRYDYPNGFQLKFDICCQFGLWDRAKAVLDDWKKADPKDPDQAAAAAKMYLLTGKLFKATMTMAPMKHKLPFEQVQDFRLQLDDLECHYPRQVLTWDRRAKEDPENDFALLSLAQSLWHYRKYDAAKKTAEKALALLDNVLTQDLTEEAIFRSRRCLALALAGRGEEARAELVKTRSLPLCHHCEYGGCKDADIYEAMIEEILGNPDKALALFRAGKEKWPDDTDFAAGIARLTKRGKKKC